MAPVTTAPLDILAPPLPTKLQVEVTGSCNLRCRMCIVSYRPILPRSASMPFEDFRRLLDAMPNVEEVVLQGIGEPLLAPDIFEMIEHASGQGRMVEFNTNATLLTRRVARRLIDSGLDRLHISLDGATPETYEFVRRGSDWHRVVANIRGLAELVRESGGQRPQLSLVIVLMRRNFHELPALVELAASLGVREVFAQNLSHDFSDVPTPEYAEIADYVDEQTILALPPGEVEAVFQAARAAADRVGVDLRLPEREEAGSPLTRDGQPGCEWPWRGGYTTYDGRVLPCCMVMGSDRVVLGDLKEKPFAEIWTDAPFREFRRGLVEGDPHPVCRGCSFYRGRF
jgi:MoaA/NifB/PqqE/SkfB family radical SAM enzyme